MYDNHPSLVENSLASIRPSFVPDSLIANPRPIYFAKPTASFGYYRGNPIYCGDSDSGQGDEMQPRGEGEFALGQGPIKTTGIDMPLGVIIPLLAVAALLFAFLCNA